MQLFYRPGRAVLGDVIPFYDNGEFKPFYLKNARDDFTQQSGWYMLTTRDHVHFTEHDTGIKGGTGSVIKVDGTYHLFYCTFDLEPRKQYVAHAVSDDLDQWKTLEEETFTADGKIYDTAEWRDPFVFWNEEEQKWWMILASCLVGSRARHACVGLCVSDDLHHWEYREPLYSPTAAPGACECPDLFKMGDWYYLVYSNYCDRFQTMYRMSKSLKGPWVRPPVDSFDSCAYYAAKTGTDGVNRYIYGWNPTKELPKNTFNPGNLVSRDCRAWDWGGSMVVHQVLQNPDGTLRVIPVKEVEDALSTEHKLTAEPVLGQCEIGDGRVKIKGEPGFGGVLMDQVPQLCRLKGKVKFKEGCRRFGVALQMNENFDKGYYLYMEPARDRIEYVSGIRFYGDGGKMFPYAVEMERPIRLEPEKEYSFEIFVEGTILVVYLGDEIAMNARMYDYSGRRFGLFAIDGEAEFTDLKLYTE